MQSFVPPPVTPGEVLAGKYRVEKLLGEGGMGVVVQAKNIALNTTVAIKLLRQNAVANAEALGRFQREAQAAASLRSEHVARVSDVGALADGRPYMVMEYLQGRDLAEELEHRQRPFDIPVAVDFVLQACEAIVEAHSAGIIHRDLKPRNLFLTKTVDGRDLVKVLDFGISKVEGAQDMQLTRTTEIIGSPSYMSPEQLRASRDVDARTDIWALGVILYELLTGRLPFYAETVTQLVAVVLMENEPPLRSLRPDAPAELEAIIHKCLGKTPYERMGSVVELAHALEPFSTGQFASYADRARGVAVQSGRISGPLPPPAMSSGRLGPNARTGPSFGGSSSSRVQVHGGTSVAWGETQMDAPKKPASKLPIIFGAAAALFVGAGAAAGGAVWYVKRASATMPTAMPLPSGRKDLPPIVSAEPPPQASVAVDVPPSALPETRLATPSAKPTTTAKKPPATPPTHTSEKPPANPDDLNNIGRR